MQVERAGRVEVELGCERGGAKCEWGHILRLGLTMQGSDGIAGNRKWRNGRLVSVKRPEGERTMISSNFFFPASVSLASHVVGVGVGDMVFGT